MLTSFFSFLVLLLGKKSYNFVLCFCCCLFVCFLGGGCCWFLILNKTLLLKFVTIYKGGYNLSIEIKQFHWQCSSFLSNYDKQGPKFGTGPKFAGWDSH